jgi:hypothetical protein
MNAYEITAVESVNAPLSKDALELTKKVEEHTLDTIPDDKNIYWADVKKAYPQLENQLKTLFKGKDKISVKDLKELVQKVPQEEAKFWISQTTWESGLQRELGTEHPQIVVQLNISNALIKDIHSDKTLQAFFKEVSKMNAGQSLHPTHSQTVAWARVYTLADRYIIEEIQSDIFGATTKLRDVANGKMEEILKDFTTEEQNKIQEFVHKHFVDWDKKLLATVISMARKNSIKDIWIFDEEAKKVNSTSPSKLERFYKVLPRDLGFKRDKIAVDDKEFTGWHRVVANTYLSRMLAS